MGSSILGSIPDLIGRFGLFGKVIFSVVLLMSVISWGVILERAATFRQNRRNIESFIKAFRSYSRLSHLLVYQSYAVGGAVSRVFEEACSEIPYLVHKDLASTALSEEQLRRVRGALDRRIEVEVANLERNLYYLAVTGTAAPYLGFLGTVWGIMKAFLQMGASRTTDLYVIGPGIAESLINTVVGLLAAIPALAAYNYFVNQVRMFEVHLNNFASEFYDTLAKGTKQ